MSNGMKYCGMKYCCLCLFLQGTAYCDPPNTVPSVNPSLPALTQVLTSAFRDGLQGRQPGTVSELKFGRHWTSADPANASVVLVPGLFGSNGSMKRIQTRLERGGLAVAVYRYADQLAIDVIADDLYQTLRRLERDEPSRKICLVTHLMGGIIARAAIEPDEHSLERLKGLVMIAPPNQGTALAAFDAEKLGRLLGGSDAADGDFALVDQMVGSFIGTAKDSLRPDSKFLSLLNQGPPKPGVRYTIVAGTAGPIAAEMVELPILLTDLLLGGDPNQEKALAPLRTLAANDEWVSGRGDGIVSVKSTHLRGVRDQVVLPFGHNDFGSDRLNPSRQQAVQQVADVVMDRVKQSSGKVADGQKD